MLHAATHLRPLAASIPATAPFADDLAIACEAALRGGAAVRRHYRRGDLTIEESTRGPVTNADRDSQAAISEFLRDLRPSDAILSEEAPRDHSDPDGGRLWVVDPLDGTREFIDGIGEFSVMVGLAVNGSAVLGAVYRPDPGILYAGVSDRCAWRFRDEDDAPALLNVRLAEGSRNVSPAGLRLTRSRSHPDQRLQRLESTLAPTSVILSGSVGVKCALIADGEADLYVHPVPYLKEWDTCAPEAVLRGAGGRVTDCCGSELTYGKSDPAQTNGIFAASPEAWRRNATSIIALFAGS